MHDMQPENIEYLLLRLFSAGDASEMLLEFLLPFFAQRLKSSSN
jgi:hypothetical protein